MMRFANAFVTPEQLNAVFVQIDQAIFLITVEPIRKGDEILTWYGEETLEILRNVKQRDDRPIPEWMRAGISCHRPETSGVACKTASSFGRFMSDYCPPD